MIADLKEKLWPTEEAVLEMARVITALIGLGVQQEHQILDILQRTGMRQPTG